MGTSVNVYVGPFIRIPLQPITYSEQLRTCGTATCDQHEKPSASKFCSDCGSVITEITKTRNGVRSWSDFDPDWKYESAVYSPEYLGGEDEEILISNNIGASYVNLDDGENVLAFSEVDQGEALAKFVTQHAEMLTAMKQFFGDTFTVEFGVCAYWC